MNQEKRQIWFQAKKYGIGWGFPVAWQGWVVLLVYVALVLAGIIGVLESASGEIWIVPYILLLTLLLVFICWKKGEKAKWRWGGK